MSDTQALLSRIAALRQRLEQIPRPTAADGPEALRRLVEDAADYDALVDDALRPLTGSSAARPMPAQLTTRARRLLERGRDLLARLRPLADQVDGLAPDGRADPLGRLYRETAAMTDTALRMVQAFPDAPGAQLRLCEGLEPILDVVAHRLEGLTAGLADRRREAQRLSALADLLAALAAGAAGDVKPFVALAEGLAAEAEDGAPLRFQHAPADEPARFVAAHSLNVARVIARVARADPDLRGRPLEPVLAALVHDVGMLLVPAEVLAHPGPLTDAQRRALEAHTRLGAALAVRLLPEAAWLAEAAGGHHERLDGTGYPGGVRDLQITSLTRLLAVCDVYAALASPRPHRPARETRAALTDTLLLAEGGALDRQHAERLLQLAFYPVGSAVEFADGSVGVVVATPVGRRELNSLARPVVVVLTDPQGRPLPSPRPLDLGVCERQSIVRALSPGERRELLGGRYPEWA